MSHKRADQITTSGKWAKHLRPYGKRVFWKAERRAYGQHAAWEASISALQERLKDVQPPPSPPGFFITVP
jgi:hypothetical protein